MFWSLGLRLQEHTPGMLLKQRVRYVSGVIAKSWGCLLYIHFLPSPPQPTLYLSARLRVSAANKKDRWIWRQVESYPILSLPFPAKCLAESAATAEPSVASPSCQTCTHDTSSCLVMPDPGIHCLPLSLQPRSCTDFLPSSSAKFPPWTPIWLLWSSIPELSSLYVVNIQIFLNGILMM